MNYSGYLGKAVELGKTLRSCREERGKSLEEVQQAIKVRKVFLEALEIEDFDSLPPRVHSVGFLRKYASYLGLDPEPLIPLLRRDDPPAIEPLPEIRGVASFPWASWLITAFILLLLVGVLGLRMFNSAETSKLSAGIIPEQIPGGPSSGSPGALAGGVDAQPSPTPDPSLTLAPAFASSFNTPTPVPTRPKPTATSAPAPTVPALAGMSAEEGSALLESVGLQMRTEEAWSDTSPSGTIISQNPTGGQGLPRSGYVLVVVSKGTNKIAVPNVVGLPEKAAQQVLTQAGLVNSPWVNYQGRKQLPASTLNTVCMGCVLSTTPGPGQLVAPGTTVHMAVRSE